MGTNGGTPPTPTFTGNWQINLTDPESPDVLGAYLSQEGTNASGVIDFDSGIICTGSSSGPVSGSGTLQNNTLNLSFANNAQQPSAQFFIQQASVVFTTTEVFSGNYQLSSKCGTTDGVVTGQQIPSFAGIWAGTTQLQGQFGSVQIAATMTEGPMDSTGFPIVSGTVTMTGTPCFTTGTLTGHQEGPYLDWTVNTADGSIVPFLVPSGFLNIATGQLTLNFAVNGGLCNGDRGTLDLRR